MTTGRRDVGSYMDRNWDEHPPRNLFERQILLFKKVVADPLVRWHTFFKSKQEPYYWYHRKYQRVPTVDQCWDYDSLCKFEAEVQLKRDKQVEENIISILRQRLEDCMMYERYEREKCRDFIPILDEAETNFFIKYGDMAYGKRLAERVLMKQKHRMAWERRHGEVGTGMRQKYYRKDGSVYYK